MKKWEVFVSGVFEKNPIFIMTLGICSSLAVTTMVENAVFMAVVVLVTTIVSSFCVSRLRKIVPPNFRFMAYMLIISTLVILMERVLTLFVPEVARALGAYVGLVITNCIVMGRIEAFAIKNPPGLSALDAAGVSFGYGLVLIFVASIRETIGLGTFYGMKVFPPQFPNCEFLVSAPGAFLILAFSIFLANHLKEWFLKGET